MNFNMLKAEAEVDTDYTELSAARYLDQDWQRTTQII